MTSHTHTHTHTYIYIFIQTHALSHCHRDIRTVRIAVVWKKFKLVFIKKRFFIERKKEIVIARRSDVTKARARSFFLFFLHTTWKKSTKVETKKKCTKQKAEANLSSVFATARSRVKRLRRLLSETMARKFEQDYCMLLLLPLTTVT